jgi:hypothetical protein
MYVQFAQARSGSMDRHLEEIANTVVLSMPSDISHVSGHSTLTATDQIFQMATRHDAPLALHQCLQPCGTHACSSE